MLDCRVLEMLFVWRLFNTEIAVYSRSRFLQNAISRGSNLLSVTTSYSANRVTYDL